MSSWSLADQVLQIFPGMRKVLRKPDGAWCGWLCRFATIEGSDTAGRIPESGKCLDVGEQRWVLCGLVTGAMSIGHDLPVVPHQTPRLQTRPARMPAQPVTHLRCQEVRRLDSVDLHTVIPVIEAGFFSPGDDESPEQCFGDVAMWLEPERWRVALVILKKTDGGILVRCMIVAARTAAHNFRDFSHATTHILLDRHGCDDGDGSRRLKH